MCCLTSAQPLCSSGAHVNKDVDSIWPYISSLTCYGVFALLAANPATLEAFFETKVRVVRGVEHILIGSSAKDCGVVNSHGLRSFVCNALRHALVQSREIALAHCATAAAAETQKPTLL